MAQAAPFDPIAYLRSGAEQPREVRRLPHLARHAVALANRADPRLFRVTVALQLLAAAMLGLQVLFGKLAIDAILTQQDGGDLGAALAPLAGLAAATAVSAWGTTAQTQLQRLLGEEVQLLTWSRILDVTTSVSLETFESPAFFDALERTRANALLRPLTLTQGLVALVGGAVSVAGLVVALTVVQPLLLPVFALGAVPLAQLSRVNGRLEFGFRAAQTPHLRLRAYLTEVLSGRAEAKEIRAFALGPVLYERWRANYAEYLGETRRHVRRRLVLASAGAAVTALVVGGSVGLLVWLVVDGRLDVAAAGAALIAVRLLAGRLQQVFQGVGDLFESALFLRDFDAFLALAPAPGPPAAPRGEVAPFTELRVEDVAFRYPGSARPALEGISLTLRAGEVVALVGENGSGKTTLAKLLAHVMAPTQGRILWDGRDTAELDPAEVRDHVGVIFQDFARYQLTARENIGFGRAERLADLDAIAQAARLGGADALIASLPAGMETSLGREFVGGEDLSLGQWQRIALARAFFRDAPFLVLDEPTASLDARSEHELFEHVRRLAADRCLLLISHRFSTVKDADRIYMLHEGRISEAGTHDELLARGGRYAEMFDLQARAYR